LILLGAPGAGKGTQAEIISEKLNIPIISTGNILKKAMREGTPLGLEAASYVNSGRLVPDPVIIGIVKERLSESDCENGYILDGVPRTIAQADALAEMGVEVSDVVSLEVKDETIIKRLTGRIICSECGATYHRVTHPPIVDGKCDRCGGELIVRSDDTEETVLKRLETYHETTEPLKDYYLEKGKLTLINGDQNITRINEEILESLGVQCE
ncbi:MAG: adenylate kinase, partial [Oscillospiraceae bacterium]|nr:adenylate kinase [Oscillospiraceae bacterium]